MSFRWFSWTECRCFLGLAAGDDARDSFHFFSFLDLVLHDNDEKSMAGYLQGHFWKEYQNNGDLLVVVEGRMWLIVSDGRLCGSSAVS